MESALGGNENLLNSTVTCYKTIIKVVWRAAETEASEHQSLAEALR